MEVNPRQPAPWLQYALRCDGAARLLHGNAVFARSAASRYYFAAYAATHSVLLGLAETPPVQGNWSHRRLPALLRTVLANRVRLHDAISYSQMLKELYDLRIIADYAPSSDIHEGVLEVARRNAGRLVKLAERMPS